MVKTFVWIESNVGRSPGTGGRRNPPPPLPPTTLPGLPRGMPFWSRPSPPPAPQPARTSISNAAAARTGPAGFRLRDDLRNDVRANLTARVPVRGAVNIEVAVVDVQSREIGRRHDRSLRRARDS